MAGENGSPGMTPLGGEVKIPVDQAAVLRCPCGCDLFRQTILARMMYDRVAFHSRPAESVGAVPVGFVMECAECGEPLPSGQELLEKIKGEMRQGRAPAARLVRRFDPPPDPPAAPPS